MALFSSIKTGAAAASLALAIAAGGFAAPAQAAVSLSLQFGSPSMHMHFGDRQYFKYCLSDDGIEARLERRGYDNVHVIRHDNNDDYNNKVWVVAQNYKGDWYQMRVDRCTHAVDKLHLIHKHQKHEHQEFDFNRFSFTYNF
jgi:hypothetical protein